MGNYDFLEEFDSYILLAQLIANKYNIKTPNISFQVIILRDQIQIEKQH